MSTGNQRIMLTPTIHDILDSPGAMALAATGDPTAAQAVSNAAAQELKLAGINWAYSPVADVNSDARNPVIGRCMDSLVCQPEVQSMSITDAYFFFTGVRSFSDGESRLSSI
jgi:hypothetical protein